MRIRHHQIDVPIAFLIEGYDAALRAKADLLVAPDGASILTEALTVDPTAYALSLRAAAVAAGAKVVQSVTVTHIARREGVTKVIFRDNRAWVREPGATSGVSVVDTLGISPWGRAARVGPAQWVPVVRGLPKRPRREVSLEATSTASSSTASRGMP